MTGKTILLFAAIFLICAMTTQAVPRPDTLETFQKQAAKFHAVVSLPKFEVTTNEIQASVRRTITDGNAVLDKVGALKPNKVNFENTVRALDDLGNQISLTANR